VLAITTDVLCVLAITWECSHPFSCIYLSQSENFNSVMANFGLDPSAGAGAMAQGNGIAFFFVVYAHDKVCCLLGSS
jgi:hypothetical protein